MSKHDITIMWGDRLAYNRFRVAVEIQNGGNMRAIARELVKVVDSAMDELQSTEAVWSDPAVRLIVNKLESLARSEATFSEAYTQCRAKA